ncbi:MAG: hypothetical protein AAFU85_26100 [Planctomycetota bacterium]
MSTVRAATQIIIPLLMVCPVAKAGESMPVLIKPSKSMRIDSQASEFSAPKNLKAVSKRAVAPKSDRLRELLDRSEQSTAEPGQIGRTQVNRFVDLTDPSRRSTSGVPSVEIPTRRSPEGSGAIRMNGLVADTPPRLRRFTPGQRTAIARHHRDEIRGLVAKEVTMPVRPLENLDQALDALSTDASAVEQSLPTVDESLRSTARRDGFGMLALDQIGDHMTLRPANEPTASSPSVAQDLRQFLQGPPPPQPTLTESTPVSGPLASRPITVGAKPKRNSTSHADVPQLPPPVRHGVTVSDRTPPAPDALPSPFHFDPDGQQPREVDELLEASKATPNNVGSEPLEKRGLFSVLFPRNSQGTNAKPSEPPTSQTQRRKRGILGRLLK